MTAPSRAVRAANRLFPKLWARDLARPPELTADALMGDAVRLAGKGNFGIPDVRPRLERLTAALKHEAGLTPLGRVLSYGGLRRALVQRLKAEALLAAHPEIEARPLAPPVVVIGAMRSGTTRLQRLLACDARFVHTRLFEALTPLPVAPGQADRRILKAHAMRWALGRLNPALPAIHPGGPWDAEEELGALELALSGAQIESQRPVPTWARWMERTPQTDAYLWLRRWLQLTGWARGDDPAKPWVLKTPQYMQDLPALLEIFPDARLLFIHRDPKMVVASAASLAWQFMRMQSETVTKTWCGAEWLHKTAHRLDVAKKARAARPDVPALDVGFQEMDADWQGAMRRVYDWLGLDLTPALLNAMSAYLARARRRHGYAAHRYTLAEFGLSAEAIDERLGGYARSFAPG